MSLKLASDTLYDTNGNELLRTSATASAVNDLTVTNAAASGKPKLSASGDDTNISMELVPKGTGGVAIGSGGTPIAKYLSATATWDPASCADGATVSTTVTVTGAAVGDPAFASLSTLTVADWVVSAFVQAADTVRVVLLNKSGGAIDLASGTLRVGVWKH